MQDRVLYQRILGLEWPWSVSDVQLDVEAGCVDIWVQHKPGISWACPDCDAPLGCYDHAPERVWRHLDTCQYQTHLHARVPRVNCPEHGVRQVAVPWADRHSRFTQLMESLIIDTLRACQSVSRTSTLTGASWDQVQGVMQRAVQRGRQRKQEASESAGPVHVGVDEKAFRKGHTYITVTCDLDRGTVEHVAADRQTESLARYFRGLSTGQLERIECIAMDMWQPYIRATHEHLPLAGEKIVFDRFHVMKLATDAVDKVRRTEHKALTQAGDDTLKHTKHLWLYAAENVPARQADHFEPLKHLNLKTSRAWAIKETLRDLWEYTYRGAARRFFQKWFRWARRSKLEPIKKLAMTLRDHLDGILTYCKHGITNGVTEGLNSTIMTIKRLAGGFRNPVNFKTAIYFHCGGLDLHPR